MRVIVSNSSGVPLYEQVKDQIKAAILAGEVAEGDALPSVRALARDLRISVITTTRAYAELAAEGYVATAPGRGAFVLPVDSALVREQLLREVEAGLSAAVASARLAGLDRDGLVLVLDTLLAAEDDAPGTPPSRRGAAAEAAALIGPSADARASGASDE